MEDAHVPWLINRRVTWFKKEDDDLWVVADNDVSEAVVPEKDDLATLCSLNERLEHLVKHRWQIAASSQAMFWLKYKIGGWRTR